MMTVVTHSRLREGSEPEWDSAMAERLATAQGRPGFVRCQLLIPLDQPAGRVIIGTWRTRADWEAWHEDETFRETRRRLDGLQEAPSETAWYEVLTDETRPGLADQVLEVAGRGRDVAMSLVDRVRQRKSG